MLFFNRDNQEQIVLNNLPKGKVFKQASKDGTDFNKIIKWLAKGFEWLVDRHNLYFKGLFICRSTFLIEQHKLDYNIPNELFYATTVEEHQADVIVLQYLMSGNTAWHFEAVAKAYGINITVVSGKEYYANSRIPNKIPHLLYSTFENTNNILVILINYREGDSLPNKIPHKLGTGLKLAKLKKIYGKMKPSQVKIVYYQREHQQSEDLILCVKE